MNYMIIGTPREISEVSAMPGIKLQSDFDGVMETLDDIISGDRIKSGYLRVDESGKHLGHNFPFYLSVACDFSSYAILIASELIRNPTSAPWYKAPWETAPEGYRILSEEEKERYLPLSPVDGVLFAFICEGFGGWYFDDIDDFITVGRSPRKHIAVPIDFQFKHTIIVDGKEVELSHEGYKQVKQLLK